MTQPKCSAKTAKGTPCQRWAVHGSKTCQAHGGASVAIAEALKAKGQCNYTKRNGERCQKPPLHGTTVCVKHGGNAAHIRRKAQQRLDTMIMPSLTKLNEILMAPGTSDADKVRVALAVLDRTGFGRGSTVDVEVTVKPWEKTMEGILTVLPEGYDSNVIDAEVVDDPAEESTGPIADYSARAHFDGPIIEPTAGGRSRVIGSANPPQRRNPYAYDED